jgi:nucleotide-binding universal stress UspA family protein
MYARVVVPLDGSAQAEQALPQAVDFAVVAGTPLHLVRIVDIAHFDPFGTRSLDVSDGLPELAAAEAEAEHSLRKVAERWGQRVADVSVDVRRGWVVDELLRVLRPDDLLVIASHGRGKGDRAIFGSVTKSMLERSPVPVVFIRARKRGRGNDPAR